MTPQCHVLSVEFEEPVQGITMSQQYSIQELADLGGVSRRTVRYYVQRGLIPAPIGSGRGAHYTQAHLDALVRVRDLQAEGVGLNEIELDLDPGKPVESARVRVVTPDLEQSVWTRIVIADGVELNLRRSHALDSQQLAAIRDALGPILTPENTTSTVSNSNPED